MLKSTSRYTDSLKKNEMQSQFCLFDQSDFESPFKDKIRINKLNLLLYYPIQSNPL